MPSIPRAISPSRSLVSPFRALLTLCAVAAMAIAAHAQTPAAPGGPTEGIKVHGHWTIDIKNADGTLASHHEFENALVLPDADRLLTAILSRNFTVGGWILRLTSGNPQTQPCADPSGGGRSDCVIRESIAPSAQGTGESTNLRVHVSPGLQLTGSISSTTIGSSEVQTVGSEVAVCDEQTAPANCTSANRIGPVSAFSRHTLPAPIHVVAGQIIQVTVEFRFS